MAHKKSNAFQMPHVRQTHSDQIHQYPASFTQTQQHPLSAFHLSVTNLQPQILRSLKLILFFGQEVHIGTRSRERAQGAGTRRGQSAHNGNLWTTEGLSPCMVTAGDEAGGKCWFKAADTRLLLRLL